MTVLDVISFLFLIIYPFSTMATIEQTAFQTIRQLSDRVMALETSVSELQSLIQTLREPPQLQKQPSLSVALCIPCVPRHIQSLRETIRSVSTQSLMPHEVIVSLSETSVEDGKALEDALNLEFFHHENKAHQRWPTLRIVPTLEKKTHTENNNIAASYATTDIISFFDADDVMHHRRVELIELAFRTLGVKMVLHSLSYELGDEFYYQSWDEENVSSRLALSLKPSWPHEPWQWNQFSDLIKLDKNNHSGKVTKSLDVLLGSYLFDFYSNVNNGGGLDTVDAGNSTNFQLTHGHMSVLNELFTYPSSLQWREADQGFGEDVLLVKSVFKKLGRHDTTAAFIPAMLTYYEPSYAPSKWCVLGMHILYDCHVGYDEVNQQPTLHFAGYDTVFCEEGTHPGYYINPKDPSEGIACLAPDERATKAPGLRYLDHLFTFQEDPVHGQRDVYDAIGFHYEESQHH